MHPILPHSLKNAIPLGGAGVDLSLRIEALRDPRKFVSERGHSIDHVAMSRVRETAKLLSTPASITDSKLSTGTLVALAYPDRLAKRRSGDAPRYLMAGGKGAIILGFRGSPRESTVSGHCAS